MLWFGIESEWEEADAGIYVPIKVQNRLFRFNRKSTKGFQVEAFAAWKLNCAEDSNLNMLSVSASPLEGPLTELRFELQKALQRRMAEARAEAPNR